MNRTLYSAAMTDAGRLGMSIQDPGSIGEHVKRWEEMTSQQFLKFHLPTTSRAFRGSALVLITSLAILIASGSALGKDQRPVPKVQWEGPSLQFDFPGMKIGITGRFDQSDSCVIGLTLNPGPWSNHAKRR